MTGGAIAAATMAWPASRPRAAGVASGLRDALADPAAASLLGQRVPATPEEVASLVAELPTTGGTTALRAEIARRIAADLSAVRLRIVDGWVMARTEALVCAALAAEDRAAC